MTRLRKMAEAAAAIAALLLIAPSSEAQVSKQQSAQATQRHAVTKTNLPQATKKPQRHANFTCDTFTDLGQPRWWLVCHLPL